jgi:hypothetical protein
VLQRRDGKQLAVPTLTRSNGVPAASVATIRAAAAVQSTRERRAEHLVPRLARHGGAHIRR